MIEQKQRVAGRCLASAWMRPMEVDCPLNRYQHVSIGYTCIIGNLLTFLLKKRRRSLIRFSLWIQVEELCKSDAAAAHVCFIFSIILLSN